MDDNTAFVWVLGILFVAVALVRIAYWISRAAIERSRERTERVRLTGHEREDGE